MTKIGEGSYQPPEIPKPENELKSSAMQFKTLMEEYKNADEDKAKKHLVDRMGKEMSLMDAAAQGSSKKEIRVQEEKVSDDFKNFQQNPSSPVSETLEHDLNTLRESLEH